MKVRVVCLIFNLLNDANDSLILNKYHLHLLSRLEPHLCTVKGINGSITNTVTHKGILELFGIEITTYYSPCISKAVVSEGILVSN